MYWFCLSNYPNWDILVCVYWFCLSNYLNWDILVCLLWFGLLIYPNWDILVCFDWICQFIPIGVYCFVYPDLSLSNYPNWDILVCLLWFGLSIYPYWGLLFCVPWFESFKLSQWATFRQPDCQTIPIGIFIVLLSLIWTIFLPMKMSGLQLGISHFGNTCGFHFRPNFSDVLCKWSHSLFTLLACFYSFVIHVHYMYINNCLNELHAKCLLRKTNSLLHNCYFKDFKKLIFFVAISLDKLVLVWTLYSVSFQLKTMPPPNPQ